MEGIKIERAHSKSYQALALSLATFFPFWSVDKAASHTSKSSVFSGCPNQI
jgi:hypothetical protein